MELERGAAGTVAGSCVDSLALASPKMRQGLQTLRHSDMLPKTKAGNHIAVQLLRSATSSASNYAEARGAESKSDFIHKLGLVFKDPNESEVWPGSLKSRKMIPGQHAAKVLEECKALCRIIAATRRTALNGRKRFD